jgi:putative hydrolase of the HAD superfamily
MLRSTAPAGRWLQLERFKLITLDITGTLMRLRAPVGQQYKDMLVDHCTTAQLRGQILSLATDDVARSFVKAYSAKSKAVPCFGGSKAKEWWEDVAKNTFIRLGVAPTDLDAGGFSNYFEQLFQFYSSNDAWELLPGASDVISGLASWRAADSDRRLCVISNWDDRLVTVLGELEILQHFDVVMTSSMCGYEKPDKRIFEKVAAQAGLATPCEAIHCGDNFKKDVIGATNAGWSSIYIGEDGWKAPESNNGTEHKCVKSLTEIAAEIDRGAVG